MQHKHWLLLWNSGWDYKCLKCVTSKNRTVRGIQARTCKCQELVRKSAGTVRTSTRDSVRCQTVLETGCGPNRQCLLGLSGAVDVRFCSLSFPSMVAFQDREHFARVYRLYRRLLRTPQPVSGETTPWDLETQGKASFISWLCFVLWLASRLLLYFLRTKHRVFRKEEDIRSLSQWVVFCGSYENRQHLTTTTPMKP